MITLGVIGVVSALTMPALIANYQKHVLFNQFKRAYTNMYNALKLTEAQLGYIPQCYYTYENPNAGNDKTQVTECGTFYEELTKRMNVIKKCEGNALRDGCLADINGVDTIEKYEDTSSIVGCGGFSKSRILNKSNAYVLNDGSVIFLYGNGFEWGCVFAIDVNGKKGPNKWGYDIFALSWNEVVKGQVALRPGTCTLVEEGGVSPVEILYYAAK